MAMVRSMASLAVRLRGAEAVASRGLRQISGGEAKSLVIGDDAMRTATLPARARPANAAASVGARFFCSSNYPNDDEHPKSIIYPEYSLLELEIKFERSLSAYQRELDKFITSQKADFDEKLADTRKEFDEKVNSLKAITDRNQKECMDSVRDINTTVKLLAQRFDHFKESSASTVDNVKYTTSSRPVLGC